ncbi:hypothetical protein [Streptomyces wuyuanensis]|uniref:hypothetical protein n=1 Tax=Streptomyces wuyuanensis TaxID=1196353 RepID=UPI00342D23A9
MGTLPDDLELRKLSAAGKTDQEIADDYGVTSQAVAYRLNRLGVFRKGPRTAVLQSMPWDLSCHPRKRELTRQRTFLGLRYFVMKRLGQDVSENAERDLRYFMHHVINGEVLTLHPERGFVYVPRATEDGSLVVRWPADRELTDVLRAIYELRPDETGESVAETA